MGRNELYIGNLNKDVSSRDIENVFRKHGKVLRCDVKNKGTLTLKLIKTFLI